MTGLRSVSIRRTAMNASARCRTSGMNCHSATGRASRANPQS
jgi:hypothetical protein